jgi:hypothetical protein
MNENDPAQQQGETIGIASGLQIPDFDPPPPADAGAPGAEPKGVLFVADDVNPNDVLDGVEIVRVSVDVIREQIQRRT